MNISPDSELDAVNRVLSIVGQGPVSALDDETSVDVVNARSLIAQEKRRLLVRGWWFNTETVTLHPDALSGLIRPHGAYLLMAASRRRLVIREGFIFDLQAGTNRFNGPLTLEVIRDDAFEDLPEVVRNYITAKASRRFQARFMGAAELDAEAGQEEAEAWAALQEYEMDYGAYNLLTDNRTVRDLGER